VPFLIERKFIVSKNWLLGLTFGGYATLSFALYFIGGALLSASRFPAGDAHALLFLVPGLFVSSLDFIQIRAEEYFKYKPREWITCVALSLNAIAAVGLCALLALTGVLREGFGLLLLLVTAASFILGISISLFNVFWVLISAKARSALVITVLVCFLLLVWPLYRTGLFTENAGRYATHEGRTIYLHPSGVNFQIPEDWQSWNAEFHNNLHLTHRELTSVRFGAGEWDYEYAEIVNSALPFRYCAAHIGGEGWGREAVSFRDLQMRVYITDSSSQEIFQGIGDRALATAKRMASNFGAPQVQFRTDQRGPWRRAVVQYSLWCGDYGGTANVEFYVRPVSKWQLVMVFMGSNENEKDAILNSVTIPISSERP